MPAIFPNGARVMRAAAVWTGVVKRTADQKATAVWGLIAGPIPVLKEEASNTDAAVPIAGKAVFYRSLLPKRSPPSARTNDYL